MSEIDELSSNKKLAEQLLIIASFYSSGTGSDKFRAKTFKNAADVIANYPIAIISSEQLNGIRGIGESVKDSVSEYLITGKIQRLENLKKEYEERFKIIELFRSVYGVGPQSAIKWYNEGYRTLEDLYFGNKLNDKQKLGIKWLEHLKLRIPRKEMDEINNKLQELLDKYVIRWDMAGSYRRKEENSGDIDLLVEETQNLNMSNLLNLFKPILADDLAIGRTKYMGILRLSEQHNGRRIDIRIVAPEEYPAALLYFTGSQKFNILLRSRANIFGYTLNEYGLFNAQGQRIEGIASEADIFRELRVKYLSPEERTRDIVNLEYF